MGNETNCNDAAGGYGNKILYIMCAQEPSHTDESIVRSKARMIAKVYDVSRNLGKDWDLVAKALCDKKLALDRLLSSLDALSFSSANLAQIVKVHGKLDHYLCKQLTKAGGNRKVHSRASFVAKYLHFHRPDTFPILDSLAELGVKGQIAGRLPTVLGKSTSERYERFCMAILLLRSNEKFQNKSLRQIDEKLVKKGRKARGQKQQTASPDNSIKSWTKVD